MGAMATRIENEPPLEALPVLIGPKGGGAVLEARRRDAKIGMMGAVQANVGLVLQRLLHTREVRKEVAFIIRMMVKLAQALEAMTL